MTQLEMARKHVVSPEMVEAARSEDIDPEVIAGGIAAGVTVIPANRNHAGRANRAVGKGLTTKVNANIGTSSDSVDIDCELAKLKMAVDCKADAVMDLSTGGDINHIRRTILRNCPVPLGTVPIYQAGIRAIQERGSIVDMTADDLLEAIAEQARDGVDFMTVHCGVTLASLERLKRQKRLTDIVSRGGAFTVAWMLHHGKDNPLYEHFDRLLDIARTHDVTLSLGDGMRPGSVIDATDRAQIEELVILGELVERAREAGVQVIVEGPGHVPLDQVVANIQIQKSLCKGAPFYVLGPLVTDIGAGYDHITAAIGGAIAAAAGADFLCYVTPSEHLALPTIEDVRDGVIAARIAGHAADIAKGVKHAIDRDREMSQARKALDWEKQLSLSMDPGRAREVHERFASPGKACSMCGDYCAMKLVEKYLGICSPQC